MKVFISLRTQHQFMYAAPIVVVYIVGIKSNDYVIIKIFFQGRKLATNIPKAITQNNR